MTLKIGNGNCKVKSNFFYIKNVWFILIPLNTFILKKMYRNLRISLSIIGGNVEVKCIDGYD